MAKDEDTLLRALNALTVDLRQLLLLEQVARGLYPRCGKCKQAIMVPLSDYGQEGSTVVWKAWTCLDPNCAYSVRVDKGEISYVTEGVTEKQRPTRQPMRS